LVAPKADPPGPPSDYKSSIPGSPGTRSSHYGRSVPGTVRITASIWRASFSISPRSVPSTLTPTGVRMPVERMKFHCEGYVPRVVPSSVAAKRREFRLELAASRRIVPQWTSIRTLGHRRGSRGLELVDPPRDPPSLVAPKADPPGTPPRIIKVPSSEAMSHEIEGLDPPHPSLVAPKLTPPWDPPRIIKVPSQEVPSQEAMSHELGDVRSSRFMRYFANRQRTDSETGRIM
jgi:hypothetical protein